MDQLSSGERTMLVTVVMATWNGERFIEEQLESITNQTYPVDQLIIRDDGSNDNTLVVCRRFEGIFRRFTLKSNSIRLGPTMNFFAALEDAAGEVVILCDQDDVWKPNKVETLVRAFQKQEVLAVYHSASLIDQEGSPLGVNFPDLKECEAAQFSALRPVYGMSLAFSGRLLTLFRGKYSHLTLGTCGHDYWIYSVAMMFGDVRHLSASLAQYRQHDTNYTGRPKRGSLLVKNEDRRSQYYLIERRMRALIDAVQVWEQDGLLRDKEVKLDVIQHYRFVRKSYQEKLTIYKAEDLSGQFKAFKSILALVLMNAYRPSSGAGLGYRSFLRDVGISIVGACSKISAILAR